MNSAPKGVLIGDKKSKRGCKFSDINKMDKIKYHIHPMKWFYPITINLEEGCHRQHIYRVERRLKNGRKK